VKDTDQEDERRRRSMRALLVALALGACVLPGALAVDPPGPLQGPDPLVCLVWLALIAPAVGCAAAALDLRGWPYAAAVPGAWIIALVVIDGASQRDLPSPLWAALAITGCFYFGLAVGIASRRRVWTAVASLLLASCALVAAPLVAGSFESQWPPGVASKLLDLSPATLFAESAGLDWMRAPGIYSPVGVDRFERASFSGALAGPAVLLVGCAAWAFAAWLAKRRSA
jgi:hypothetical protein